MKNAPRAGPNASEHRFLTFTEPAVVIQRRRPFPLGGGLAPAFRKKRMQKSSANSMRKIILKNNRNYVQNVGKIGPKTKKNALEN